MEFRSGLYRLTVGIVVFLLAFLPACVFAEDIAIVVGVGKYPHLKEADLPGIDNDVAVMNQALTISGFRVITLFDAKAGKAAISQAFSGAAKRVKPGDRFVYYHSSHGSEDNKLLTSDTHLDGSGTISRSELRQWMESIKTPAKSLLIDACFSGGFMKSRGVQGEILKTKFFPLKNSIYQDRFERLVSRSDNPFTTASDAVQTPRYAIFASSQADQRSHIIRIKGKAQSVFTHYLGALLGAKKQLWGEVVQPAIHSVNEFTGNTQTPVFTSAFLERRTFGGSSSPIGTRVAGTPVGSFLHLYSFANARPEILSLQVQASTPPNSSNAFHPETQMRFRFKAQHTGYLFLLNVDDQNMAQLVGWGKEELEFQDQDRILKQSQVTGDLLGREIEIGMGTLAISTSARVGGETWKAFLFESQDRARAFIAGWSELQKKGKVGSEVFKDAMLDRGLQVTPRLLTTAEVSYKVTDK